MGKRNTETKISGLRLNPKNPLSGVDFLDSNLISDFFLNRMLKPLLDYLNPSLNVLPCDTLYRLN